MTMKYVIILTFLSSLVVGQRRRPNIVLMVSDDQDVMLGSLRVMSNLRETIMQNGVKFSNAFTTTPICCPSRSSILTGLYAHNHNVLTNNDNCSSTLWQRYFETRSYASYLHSNGYFTGYFGKYLNEYNGSYTPPGWDYWMGLVKNSKYYNYTLLHNGRKEVHGNNYAEDYLTDLVTNRSIEFFKASKRDDRERPILAVVSFPAPHGPEDGAPQYANLYGDDDGHKTESFDYVPNFDKHWIIRQREHKMDTAQLMFSQLLQQKRLQTLRSVDDGVKKIVDMLQEIQELDNTYLIYVSDHGYHIGQFGIPKGKTMPYDFDIRIPFAMRGPGIPRNETSRKIALNIDVAPTILGIAGVPIPEHMDGRNLLDIFSEERTAAQPWRDSFLIERGKVNHYRRPLIRPRMKTKIEKLQKLCGSPNYIHPCQPGQYWTCVTGADHKLRLQKCKKPGKVKAKTKTKTKRKNRCQCPPNMLNRHQRNEVNVLEMCGRRGFLSPNFKGTRSRSRVGKRLHKRMLSHSSSKEMEKRGFSSYNKLRRERRYKRDVSMRHNGGSPANGQHTNRSMILTTRCRLYMPHFEIRCSEDLYNDPYLWVKHMGHLARSVKTLQLKMKYMKTLRTCLNHYDSMKSRQLCDCSLLGPSSKSPKMNVSHPLLDESGVEEREFQQKQKIFQEQREIHKVLKETRLAKIQRKQKRIQRGGAETKRCGYQGLTCFLLSNKTWDTEPRWHGDSHCYCTNSNNNTYWCIRIINENTDALYCQFITGFREYFNLIQDPYQLVSQEMSLQDEEKVMYQGMIKSLRDCKGNVNCTLPPFVNPYPDAIRSSHNLTNTSSVVVQHSPEFDSHSTPDQVQQTAIPSSPLQVSQDVLDVLTDQLHRRFSPQNERGKGGRGKMNQWTRGRSQKTKEHKPKNKKFKKRRRLYHRTGAFMDDRNVGVTRARAGQSAPKLRKSHFDPRRRSRNRINRRI